MAALSDYTENKLLNHVLRGNVGSTAYAQPTSLYLALFKSDPTELGTGTEITGGSYTRQPITFDAPSAGQTQNSGPIEYTSMPAVPEGVSHVAVYDALSSGNMLIYGPLSSTPIVLHAGDTFRINAQDLKITLD
jgi:hypothetical protein